MKPYYVYAHKTTCGRVYYVGKGEGDRINQTGNRNDRWKAIRKDRGCEKVFLEVDLSEDEAYLKEVLWIKHFKSIGQCDANVSLGGKGVMVEKRWWGDKIANSLKGIKRKSGRENHSFKDVITKEELIDLYVEKKMSSVEIGAMYGVSCTTVLSRVKDFGIKKRAPGRESVPIMCETDGLIFDSINDAAKHYNLFRENIRKVLDGKYNHTGGKKFRHVSGNSKVGSGIVESTGRDERGDKG